MPSEQSYGQAIEALERAVEVINGPLGVAWGLRRGQVGWYHAARARDELDRLAGDFRRHDRIAEEMSQSYFANFCRQCWLDLPKSTRPDGDPTGPCACGAPAILRAAVWP